MAGENDRISELELIVANSCNLGCIYCSTNEGRYDRLKSDLLMSEEVALNAVSCFLNKICQAKKAKILFFGGEPLLNWRVILSATKHARAIAKKKGIKIQFMIDTNGVLLDESIVRDLARYRFIGLLSIDSHIARINDRLRPLKSGKSALRRINANIRRVPEIARIFTPRATISRINTDLYDYVRHFYKLGFGSAYFYPCIASTPELIMTRGSLKRIDDEFSRIVKWNVRMMDKTGEIFDFGFRPEVYHLIDLKPPAYCDRGRKGVTITHDGNIYPCSYLTFDKDYRVGSISSGINERKLRAFLKTGCSPCSCECERCSLSDICGPNGCRFLETRFRKFPKLRDRFCEWMRIHFKHAKIMRDEIQKRFTLFEV